MEKRFLIKVKASGRQVTHDHLPGDFMPVWYADRIGETFLVQLEHDVDVYMIRNGGFENPCYSIREQKGNAISVRLFRMADVEVIAAFRLKK